VSKRMKVTEDCRKCKTGVSQCVLIVTYYQNDQAKVYEMGGACGTHGRNEICSQTDTGRK
jgi:hypothetical protein